MTDKEKIRAEIERLYVYWDGVMQSSAATEAVARKNICKELLSFIDSLQEEPVSEDLEEAIDGYTRKVLERTNFLMGEQFVGEEISKAVSFGANWQKQQDDKILNEKQWEAWAKGGEEMKQELMKSAKSGVVSEEGDFIEFEDGTAIDLDPSMQLNPAFICRSGDNVKVIVIKEE